MKKVRVMVIDDAALVREILVRGLSLDPGIEVAGTAGGLEEARHSIGRLKPDVVILDGKMYRRDSEFLHRLMVEQRVVVLTDPNERETAAELEAGAFACVSTPGLDVAGGLNAMLHELREKVKAAGGLGDESHPNRGDSR